MTKAEDSSGGRLSEVVGGRFCIRRLVAYGGMADVYEAEDTQTARVGALKLLKARFRHVPSAVERLSREAQAASRIADPHIVETLDAGRLASGEPYLFMELLAGEALDRVLARRGRLPLTEALQVALQASRGLCAAHAAGVLHRDIKPANLFLVAGPQTLLKLLDFGVSKVVGSGMHALTQEGHALGTFSYMPPEQMMGAKRVDERADLFSLGVVIYQCLVGKPPFAARSIPALSNLMAKNEYAHLAQVRPDAPPTLDALVAHMLRADPAERLPSASALREELTRISESRSAPERAMGDAARLAPHRTVNVGEGPPSRPPRAEPRKSDPAGRPGRPSAPLVETIVPRTRKLR